MLTLKIGIDEIFREPLGVLSQGNYPIQSNHPMIIQSFSSQASSRSIRTEVTPKFATGGNSRAQIKEKLSKINSKIGVLDKILKLYFDDSTNQLMTAEDQELADIEGEIMKQKGAINVYKSNDYNTFKLLCNFISSLEVENINSEINSCLDISPEQYDSLSDIEKQNILDFIHKYKNDLIANLNINTESKEDKKYISSSPSKIIVTYEAKNTYDAKKFNLFRMYVDNMDLPDDHVAHYLNANATNLVHAIEKYFQNSYQLAEITLYFVYEETTLLVTKKEVKHFFSFVASVDELFNQVKVDFPRLTNYRLFALNGKEIIRNNPKIKFVGALHLLNKSVIKVKY